MVVHSPLGADARRDLGLAYGLRRCPIGERRLVETVGPILWPELKWAPPDVPLEFHPWGCAAATARSLAVLFACPSQLFHLRQKPWNSASPSDTLSDRHKIIEALSAVFRELFVGRAVPHTELLALRQQRAVLKRKRSGQRFGCPME